MCSRERATYQTYCCNKAEVEGLSGPSSKADKVYCSLTRILAHSHTHTKAVSALTFEYDDNTIPTKQNHWLSYFRPTCVRSGTSQWSVSSSHVKLAVAMFEVIIIYLAHT